MKANPYEEAVRQALHEFDTQQGSSEFARDWRVAELKVKQGDRWIAWRAPAYVFGAVVSAVLVYALFTFTRTELPEPVLVSERRTPSEQVETLNPDHYWSSSTDQLLSIDTLAYQDKFITFASYDPITMEIIE